MSVRQTSVNRNGNVVKPAKPRRDFPLSPRGNGQWGKKVKGRWYYFGAWDDPAAAERVWDTQKEDLLAGRPARISHMPAVGSSGLTVEYLANSWLHSKNLLIESGELREATFRKYKRTAEYVVKKFGPATLVDNLSPQHFAVLRADMARRWGPTKLGNEITYVKMLFLYATNNALTQKMVSFGTEFKKPAKLTVRRARNQRVAGRSKKNLYQPSEIRDLLAVASPQAKAMIYLGLNCGFGNTDVALLPKSAIDWKHGWIRFPRVKTEIERDCPLWPETIAALNESLAVRCEPKEPDRVVDKPSGRTAGACFFVSDRGLSYAQSKESHWLVSHEFRATVKAAIEKRTEEDKKLSADKRKPLFDQPGRGFYTLKHNFCTWGADSRDRQAVEWLVGYAPRGGAQGGDHQGGGIFDEHYCQEIIDERKQAVVDAVHKRLMGPDSIAK